MFQSLRGGSPFYILYKNDPKLVVGEVVNTENLMPLLGTTFQNGIMSQPKNVVDVNISVDGESMKFQKLPADMSIADFGTGVVVSDSRDAIINEIEAFKNVSVRILNEVEKHQHIVNECDRMLGQLNPHIATEARQSREIESLKNEMADIKEMLSKALGKIKKED